MLKRFLILVCIIFFCDSLFADNLNLKPIPSSPQLQQPINKILQIPEAKMLISKIQQEGPLSIRIHQQILSEQFGAYWDLNHRTICVNPSYSEGRMIGSILFELHNAAVNDQLEHLDYLAFTKSIDRENYIRSVEYLEYENSLKASKISQAGIELGIFPVDAYLPTYKNFEEHYYYQKVGGHSYWIGKNYDQIADKRPR